MRIGILTFHCACNYGAVLQCYALQRFLVESGHDAFVVDYRPAAVADGYRWFDIRRFWARTPKRFIQKSMSEIRVIGSRKRRYEAFGDFLKTSLNLTGQVKGCEEMAALAGEFDMLIMGSDQIWNRRITGGMDRIYWGDFPRPLSTRVISYAASMEDGMDSDVVAAVRRYLPGFDAVSVREEGLRHALSELIPEVRIDVVADPVLLLSKKHWDDLASERIVNEPYLLFYQVRQSSQAYSAARELAQRKGLKLICLSAKVELDNSEEVTCASPADFVSLFRYASYVVTTSFHGTAFSLIYGKEFVCIDVSDGKGSRQKNLLDRLGSGNRIVHDVADAEELPAMDAETVNSRLEEYRKESVDYLKYCGL